MGGVDDCVFWPRRQRSDLAVMEGKEKSKNKQSSKRSAARVMKGEEGMRK